MKEILTCSIISFTTTFSILGQEKNEVVFEGLGVTSIVHCEVGEQVLKAKCPCSVHNHNKCFLYKIDVKKTIAYFENSAFSDKDLSEFEYILVPSSALIESNKEYVIAVQPSSSTKYIQYCQTLNIDLNKEYHFKHKDGYLTSIIDCDQNDRFLKYIIKSQ
ncbi:MAG: hypothetical protein AAF519_15090 [Bacteroidota bacterium]